MANFSRDLTLPDWGPYTKHYAGVSKILHDSRYSMVDFSFVIGYVRGKVIIPDVNIDMGYHHWDALPDLSYFSYRYELQWKDVEYADVEFFANDEESHMAKITFTNNTDLPHEYVATVFSALRTNRQAQMDLQPGEFWIGGEDYASLHYVPPRKLLNEGENYEFLMSGAYLRSGNDALRRGECLADFLINYRGLGNLLRDYGKGWLNARDNHTFLMRTGSSVIYRLPEGFLSTHPYIYLRCAMYGVRQLVLDVAAGEHTVRVELTNQGRSYSLDFDDLQMIRVPLGKTEPYRAVEIRVVDIALDGDLQSFVLDGLLFTHESALEEAAKRFSLADNRFEFEIDRTTAKKGLGLSTPITPAKIGLYSEDERPRPPFPYSDATVTSIFHSDMTTRSVLRRVSNDSLTNWYGENCKIWGDRSFHYAGYNLAPIVVPAHSSREVYVALVCSTQPDIVKKAEEVYQNRILIEQRVLAHYQKSAPKLKDTPFRFSQQREMAQLFSTVVYPVVAGKEVIKAYVPGKRFASLFTWDSGMHGIGLLEYAPERALEIVNMFLGDPDEEGAAVLLGGTPLPLHIYLMAEILQQQNDLNILKQYYPRLRRYQQFFAGQLKDSPFDLFKSGLLNPFLEGYNSIGVDDYPPQHYAGIKGLYDNISPVSNTAHAIRISKLVQVFAHLLQKGEEEIRNLQEWIDYLTDSLQRYSWDETSGYYSYVLNDSKQKLFYDEHTNFNMGLDGVSPLLAGICNTDQQRALLSHLMTPGEMWTEHGIVSVSMKAPYARFDGYWNGKVWMPHQWFLWKALITMGEMENAERIAQTAVRVWKNATDATYNNYEQFDARTGQGEGCHHFPGLSGPVAAFYHRYYTPGRLTAGYDTIIYHKDYDSDRNVLHAELGAPLQPGLTGVVAVMDHPGRYKVSVNDRVESVVTYTGWINLRIKLGIENSLLTIREE